MSEKKNVESDMLFDLEISCSILEFMMRIDQVVMYEANCIT